MARRAETPEQKKARLDALAKGRATRAANIAARKAAYAEKQDAIFLNEDVQTSGQEPIEEPELQVHVNVPEQPIQRVSLKDRLFGSNKSSAINKKPVAKGRPKKTENNLISTVLPTIIAGFISTYAYDKLPDPYKVCAPSKAEVNAMLGPIFSVIARRVEVTGKASQDAIDVANALICSFAYGTRAYITYISIKREEQNNGNASNNEQGYQSGSYQTAGNAVSGIGTSGNGGSVASDNLNVSNGDNDPLDNGSTEAALFANLFERDKRGRAQLGLLPTAV